ncbi:MAG: DUF4129 domain-containing protein [Firmicutes bacterium]|nr:DUF4129 domain-containing protein [Bacillota bacterium]
MQYLEGSKATLTLDNHHRDTLLAMAAEQTHWLGRMIMPLLASAFVTSLLALAKQYLMVFLPETKFPWWLLFVGAAVALGSTYAAGLHRRLRTPMSLRLGEFIGVMVVTYGFLRLGGWGGAEPFFSAVIWQERDILTSLLLVAAGWLLARGYGGTFALLGDIARDVGDQGAATFSWEAESLLSDYQVSRERARAVGYFARRLLFYAFLACFFRAIAFEGFAHRLGGLQGWEKKTNVATLVLLISGMLLQASVYLFRLQVIWEEVGIRVYGRLPRQWLWSSLVFVMIVLVVASSVPTVLSPLDFSGTMEAVGMWIGAGLQFSLPEQDMGSRSAYRPSTQIGPREGVEPSWWMALFYLLISFFWVILIVGTLLVGLGLLLFMFFSEEWERLHGLVRVPIYAYLWLRETLQTLIRFWRASLRRTRVLLKSLHIPKPEIASGTRQMARVSKTSAPSAPAMYIRHLFLLLIDTLGQHGMVPKPGETALEYLQALERKLDVAQDELRAFTEYYLRARYSKDTFSPEVRPVVKRLWQAVMESVGAWLDDAGLKAE